MPLQVRPIAISTAVMFFFGVSIVGSVSGLAPFTCCKRALAAAFVAYIASTVATRIVNAILLSAIIESQISQQRELAGGGRD
jgi:hypothetical protein